MLIAEFSETEIRHAFHGGKPEFAERKGHTAEIWWRDKKLCIGFGKNRRVSNNVSHFGTQSSYIIS